jgi:hypothetical protein
MRDAINESSASVVAVSPIVNRAILKGPTEHFLAALDLDLSVDSVVERYGDLLDGIVSDEVSTLVRTHQTNVAMVDEADRRRLAHEVLAWS